MQNNFIWREADTQESAWKELAIWHGVALQIYSKRILILYVMNCHSLEGKHYENTRYWKWF